MLFINVEMILFKIKTINDKTQTILTFFYVMLRMFDVIVYLFR